MPFAAQLDVNLQDRERQVPLEFAQGDDLAAVLTRYLLAVEAAADTDMLTSILLLEGNKLRTGAAPNLPRAYPKPSTAPRSDPAPDLAVLRHISRGRST